MSIEASYRRVTTEEFARLRDNPEMAASFFGTSLEDIDHPERALDKLKQQERNGRYLNISTDWHAMHFLLTGDGELKPHPLPPPPLGSIVQGGSETQWECTYGHVRFLSSNEVVAAADALSIISVDELRSRFNAASFNTAQIYPHGRKGRWTDENAESVFRAYPKVVGFFQAAARDGDMILLSSE